MFFGKRSDEGGVDDEEFIALFSPFLANQETTRSGIAGERRPTWSLLITANEMQRRVTWRSCFRRELTLETWPLGFRSGRTSA